jgi:hypothetical protein
MKQMLTLVLGALLVGPVIAKGDKDEQVKLKASYEEKVAREFVSFGNWTLDYDTARARAKKEGKLIFAYFTHSHEQKH